MSGGKLILFANNPPKKAKEIHTVFSNQGSSISRKLFNEAGYKDIKSKYKFMDVKVIV